MAKVIRDMLGCDEYDMEKKSGIGAEAIALVCLAVLGVAALVWLWHRQPERIVTELSDYRAQLHALVAAHAILAPFAFVAGYAAAMLFIWIPAWPCTAIGGFLFGVALGVPLSLAGSTLGAIGVFLLGRSVWARRIAFEHPTLQRVKDGCRRDAFAYLVVLRLVPIMPFGMIHVAAAYFDVPLPAFILGTAVGMVPCILIYSVLGADLDALALHGGVRDAHALLHPSILLPLCGLAVLALAPVVARRVRAKADG